MLPKKKRLDLRSLPSFFKDSKKYYSEYFTIYYQHKHNFEDEKTPFDQAAIIARKKDFKKAVERHRVVRIARAAVNPLLNKSGIKLALVLDKKAQKASVEELQKELQRFFSTL